MRWVDFSIVSFYNCFFELWIYYKFLFYVDGIVFGGCEYILRFMFFLSYLILKFGLNFLKNIIVCFLGKRIVL